MDSIPHMCHVEIQEKAKLMRAQAKIRKQLGAMNGEDPLHAFELQDQAILHDENSQSLCVLGVLCVESTPVQGISRT